MATLLFKFVFLSSSSVVLTSTELTGATAPTVNISSVAIADGTTVASVVSGGVLVYDSYTKSWSYRLASADLATYVYTGMATTTYATASPLSVHALGMVIPDELVSSRHVAGAAVAKSPATLAAADVSGNLPVDVQTIKTQAVTAAVGVAFPENIGTSTYVGGAISGITGVTFPASVAATGEAVTAVSGVAAAAGTDAASKILATPANKLATDTSGRVTPDTVTAAAPTADTVAEAVRTELAVELAHLDDDISAVLTALSAIDTTAALDSVIEGTLTQRQVLRLLLAVLALKSTGGGSNVLAFRNLADTANRVTTTVDTNGNRLTIVLDVAS